MTQKFASLLITGGAFAAAVTLGEPLSMFNTGAALLGSFGSFFGKKGGDNSQKMLAAIFRELRTLSEQIQRNHQQQMEALRQIALKIDDLEDTMNRRFAELGLDVALLQFDVRELLYEDVQVCERLAEEFALPETQDLLNRGFVGFGIWYETDNRALDYARCLNGLMARQRVTSETDFSGMLRADSMEEVQQGASITERRSAVRRLEQRVFQPTVDYIRKYAGTTDGFAIAAKIFAPATDVCGLQRIYGEVMFEYCRIEERVSWPPSRLRYSQYNPGQGVLLSPPTAILLSKITRVVAPWNGIMLDRTTAAAARIISEEEARDLSRRTASRRTRHMRSLNAAADSLDLNIAQAQVLAGLPAVPAAAELLDTVIIPAYAKARLLGDAGDLNKLLAALPPNRSEPGPNCASDHMANGAADSYAWNTLCTMEANPTFAKNVIRMFVARRLHARNVSFDTWRMAIRSPFSGAVLDLVGHDVILKDATQGVPDSTFGIWAIEVPRVYADPDVNPPPKEDGTDFPTSCWEAGYVRPLYDGRWEVDVSAEYYQKSGSGRCILLDPFTADDFTTLSFATRFHALLAERALVVGLLNELCAANPYYPAAYCSFDDKKSPPDPNNGSTSEDL